MITWGVGTILLKVQTKFECDEDLALVIRITQAKYANVFKGAWMGT
jgi:hypothetical protein